jgi:hypothetical protein
MLKKIILALVLTLTATVSLSEPIGLAGSGSCSGQLPPICISPSHPICVCDGMGANCHWACT